MTLNLIFLRRSLFKTESFYLFVFFFCCFSISSGFSQEIQLCAAIHKKIDSKKIPLDTLKLIIKGDISTWGNEVPIKLALMSPKTEEGEALAKIIFNSSANQMNKHYLAMTFKGKIEAPMFFEFEEDLIEYVNSNSNTIGVLNCKSTTKGLKPFIEIEAL